MTVELADAAATESWGRGRAAALTAGDVVLLFGPLGAGKTTLVRAMAQALGYDGPVLSPTFTILEVYPGRVPIFHFDFYRLADASELRAVDPREYYDLGISFLEWPERVRSLWPGTRIEIELEMHGQARRLTERRVETTTP
jgi:tRNA threonylcarbamoyl adenosine modification protein YjeE